MPQLVTDKSAYKIGEYITFSLTGWTPNVINVFFGIGKSDGTTPWGSGSFNTDANGNAIVSFQVGENVPPGNWLLWVWDTTGLQPAISTPITILPFEIVPAWVWYAVPVVILGIGALAFIARRR